MWPGPGKQGLQVLQIGVSQPIEELDEPFITVPSSAAVQSDVDSDCDEDIRSAMFCLLLLLCCNISAVLWFLILSKQRVTCGLLFVFQRRKRISTLETTEIHCHKYGIDA